MDDMKVANIDYSYGFGDPDNPESDWSLIKQIACFHHTEACEFIVFLGVGQFTMREEYINKGLSLDFIKECNRAAQLGYEYACFYA